MKKFFTLLFFIFSVVHVHAVYFSEIMFDPQGSDTSREWIEIYNDTSGPIDFTSWKFFEGATNHGITSSQGGASVPSNSYAVIADNPTKFLLDYPSFSGILFDSVFTGGLSNSGEHIALKESSSGVEIGSVDYDPTIGGNNDGSTLSKIDGLWVRGSATPGSVNQASTLEVVSSSTSATATTTEHQTVIAQMSPPSADIVFYMPFEKTVVAGADADFSTYGMTRAGKNIEGLAATWAFGDGGQSTGTSTKYRYVYPGRYIAQVEGTNGYVAGTARVKVHVVPPDIAIAKIDVGKYGTYVDVSNPNTYDLDISQWRLSIDGSYFPFPKNTLIGGNSTTRFSGLAMGFASTTVSSSTVVKILFPNLEEVTRFTFNPETNNNSIVLGTSTIVNKSFATSTVTTKPVIKSVTKIVKNINVATTTQQILSTASQTNQMKPSVIKDTRIIAWFKSLFTR